MPTPPVRRKPSAHGTQSLLRFLFPHTRQRARARLSQLRHETLPSLRHRTQARIYKYIVYRQARKLKGKPGIVQRLRGQTRKLLGSNYLENEARLRRQKLIQPRSSDGPEKNDMSYQEREPGGRRRKLAGYLKAANELRQTYTQQYAPGWSSRSGGYEYDDDTPGGFQDAAVVRSGEEEMILFPSYARRHIKRKPQAEPGTIQETPGDGRDVRDSAGAGDAEFWKQQWDSYEDDNAVVDVDVRGWIYSPHKGQMNRKQRLFIGLARQLVGIQAAPAGAKPPSQNMSPVSSREPSPGPPGRHELRQAERDELLASKEAEEILRKGEREAEVAAQGGYSEKPAREDDDSKSYRVQSRDSSVDSRGNLRPQPLSQRTSHSSTKSEENIAPLKTRSSWNQPSEMSPAELAEANARLMARLRHFLAIPMANTPISVFFYNENVSKQRTVYTNTSGHFTISAALDFVPTHVRVLASEKLSATEEVNITDSQGVSVISDIDDTIKHSAISSGAREIFRNAFIRDLGDLTIEGVREWYNRMADMGVRFHYVSNSPWQLFPVISKYFDMAGLPPGSFHLKQYSGMLQGIFEPVAERKKNTLDKIARDFPERSFMLIGDSGEADLEVYVDFVLENPGRVVAVFIRDVTTPEGGAGFFDQTMGSGSGDRSSSPSQQGSGSGGAPSQLMSSSSNADENDPELRAAIAASIRDLENENNRRSKSLFPEMDVDHPGLRPGLPPRRTAQPKASEPMEDLIDLSDEKPVSQPTIRRVVSDTKVETDGENVTITTSANIKGAPPLPRKPVALRSPSGDSNSPATTPKAAPPPPKPRRPPSTVHQSSPLTNQLSPTTSITKPPPPGPKPQLPPSQQTYAGMARDKLSSAYNSLPSASSIRHPYGGGQDSDASRNSSVSSESGQSFKKAPPPPPPPRRGITAYPTAAASYVGTKAASAWQNAPAIPHPSTRPNLPTSNTANAQFSTSSNPQRPQRTNTASTLGANGGVSANGTGNNNNGGGGGGGGYWGYGANNNAAATNPEYAGMNKREVLWRQRWARADEILKEKGVVLRTWRVGTDVMKEAEMLVKKAGEKEERDRRTKERKRGDSEKRWRTSHGDERESDSEGDGGWKGS
ncbi:actin patch protein 1 [Amniculicola lignicola CBS 123094]|uniref:Actin patch protein 1 n=1 Tax=Amniculicola lignicola CBS 123094 TaxID=1392246 RepID=A0A6A5WUP0_9PLEO|nr:actin patch protein 1 [Amniculicola lignicola CBS 123094]